MQRRLAQRDPVAEAPVRVRIGMAAGEPVTERNDLFGAAVQLASRLCARADPGSILVSSAVHDLAIGKGFTFRSRGRLRLKGFESPMLAFEVIWAAEQDSDIASHPKCSKRRLAAHARCSSHTLHVDPTVHRRAGLAWA